MDKYPFEWRPPKPQALPTLRRSVVAQLNTEYSQHVLAQVIDDGDHLFSGLPGSSLGYARTLLDLEVDRLKRSRVYSLDRDMTSIAQAAARKLPSFQLVPESQPSPYGFMVFDKPLFELPDGDSVSAPISSAVVAVSWGLVASPDDKVGTWMTFWSGVNHEAMIRQLQVSKNLSRRDAERTEYSLVPDIVPYENAWFGHDDEDPVAASEIEDGSPLSWAQVVRSAWAMYTARSERRIAAVEQVPVPRPARRQAEREGYEHGDVVDVIRVHPRLRKRAARHHTTGTQKTGYKIDYQKYVSKHTRWQPYPSRNTVELITIDAYVQGPPGAPFRTREKVYRLDKKSQILANPLVPQPPRKVSP